MSVISSENPVINMCGKLALNSESNVCNSINHIWYKYNLQVHKEQLYTTENVVNGVYSKVSCQQSSELNEKDVINVANLTDLL